MFGLASSAADYRRQQTVFGKLGVAACDRALVDPTLLPRFWVRRAHLLQSKAMHFLVEKDFEAAIKVLGESDALVRNGNDHLVVGSVGLGNRALRAIALMNLSRRAEAEAELDGVTKTRPDAAAIRRMVRSIRLSGGPNPEAFTAAMRADGVLEPQLLRTLFWHHIFYSRFAEAMALYPDISFDLPRGNSDALIQGLGDHRYERIGDRAKFAGALFYALSVLGRKDEAARTIAAARKELADAMRPPPPPPEGRRQRSSVQTDFRNRVAAGTKAVAQLVSWENAAALRARAAELTIVDFAEEIKKNSLQGFPVLADMVAQIRTVTKQDQEIADGTVRVLQAQLEEVIRKEFRLTLGEMAEILPRPETATNMVRFKPSSSILGVSGVTTKKSVTPGEISISYESLTGTNVMADELSLLAAALEARKAGKDSFVVQSRMNVIRSLSSCYYFSVCGPSTPNGYESRISILPVDSATWPAERRWRVINAQQVYDRLASKYIAASRK